MPLREPADSGQTVRAWSDGGEEPTQLIPVASVRVSRTRQIWIIGAVAAAGVLVLILLGFLLLGPQQAKVPPLVPITSITPTSVTSPSAAPSPPPSSTETITETVTATSYIPLPAVTPTTGASPSTTATNPNDVWRTCHQMHPHRWCNGYR